MVGALAGHKAGRCCGAVLVSVPYCPDANALPTLVPLVDRAIYPVEEYPDGQWDYYRYYTRHFEADEANVAYARPAPGGGRLVEPVLYVNGDYDLTNSINGNQLGDPMRAACAHLIVVSMPAAHWLPLERKAELVAVIRSWLRGGMLDSGAGGTATS